LPNPSVLVERCAVVQLDYDVRPEATYVDRPARAATNLSDRDGGDDGDRGLVEDALAEPHELDRAAVPARQHLLELAASEGHVPSVGRAHVARKQQTALGLAERPIEHQLMDPAGRQPWELAVIIDAPEPEASVAIDAVPSQGCSINGNAGHRLDRVAKQMADFSDLSKNGDS